MVISKSRNIYLGANTRYGFKSLYNTLLTDQETYNLRVYILKGGPGTGKSTFVKRVVTLLKNLGCNMDIIHCSGDPASLDGVVSTEGGIAVVDGTSPHQLDPMCPGSREEIINLGEFWDATMLAKYLPDVNQFNKEKAEYYKRAYSYLNAAGAIYDDTMSIMDSALEQEKAYVFVSNLADEIFCDIEPSVRFGKDRKMFATAITPGGMLGDVNELFEGEKVYAINTNLGMSTSFILNKIKERAHFCGFDTESFLCGFDAKLEHLNIPELKTAIVSSNQYHEVQGSDMYYEYPMDGFLNEYNITRAKDDIQYNNIRFEELLDKAIRAMARAKREHSKMEEIYVSSMNFNLLNAYLTDIMQNIEETIQNNLSISE